MPFGDGTGPLGLGPMTGRGMGYCAGHRRPGFMNPGFGWRWRRRRFWRYWGPYWPLGGTISKEEEEEMLRMYLKDLEEEIEAIKQRLEELKKEK